MKALCQFFSLTILSVLLTASSWGWAEDEVPQASTAPDCAEAVTQMLRAIQAAPDQLEQQFGRAVEQSKACVCDLLTAAIKASGGSAQAVKRLVVIALENAGEQSSAIAECAVIAAPAQLEAIREAFAEVGPKAPPSTMPSVGKPAKPAKGAKGAMVENGVPGLKPIAEPEPGPQAGSPVVVDRGTASKAFPRRPSGKEALAGGRQAHEEGGGAVGEGEADGGGAGWFGLTSQFEFDYLWPDPWMGEGAGPLAEGARWYAYLENGFDSNVNTAAGEAAEDSYFVGGGVGTYYALVTGETQFDVAARFAVRYDEGAPPGLQNTIYQGHLLANLEHQLAERLRISDQVGVSYDAEPDFLSGETTGFRTDQYVFAYNRLAFGYRWAELFETRSYYTVSTIQYEDGWLRIQEDRWRHLLGQQFRLLLDDRKTAVLEYRYGQTHFQTAPNDNHSHYFVGGMDFEISPEVEGSALMGAENRSFERFSDQWRPYAEASLQSRWSDVARLRWGARLGFEDAEIGGFQSRYSFRTGLAIDRDLGDRLNGSLGFFYLYSDLDAGGQDLNGYTEDAVMFQLALSYALLDQLDLVLAYDFTSYGSGDPLRNYDRHRVRLGLNANF